MKKISFLLLVSLFFLFFSCSNSRVSVTGLLDDKYNGKTAYLYVFGDEYYSEFKSVAITEIKDGRFIFEDLDKIGALDNVELPIIGYISLFDILEVEESMAEEMANLPMATVILEKGDIQIEFEDNSVELSGTTRNIEFNKMHQAIKELMEFSSQLVGSEDIMNVPVDEQGRDGFMQLSLLDKALKDQAYAFIKDNMTNKVGEYLLLQSGDDMFTPQQTLELIEMSSESFKGRADIKELANILRGMSIGVLNENE